MVALLGLGLKVVAKKKHTLGFDMLLLRSSWAEITILLYYSEVMSPFPFFEIFHSGALTVMNVTPNEMQIFQKLLFYILMTSKNKNEPSHTRQWA
jgi:hypothetical protein